MPNKFLITQCSIRRTGAKLKICYSLSNAIQGDLPLWTKHMQCYSETITDIFHPYVRVSSPSHRVGLVSLFPLPQRQGVSAAKKNYIGGMAFILDLPVPVNARNVP